MQEKILNEFLNSNIKIKSEERLKEYITFCISKNIGEHIVFKTSHHHILPKKLFKQYKDLKENTWNGTYLLHKDHYYAHWLMTEAINDYSQLFAFTGMHCKDFKKGKLEEKDLIPDDEFQKKIEEKNKAHSIYQQTVLENGLTNSQMNSKKGVEVRKNKINPETGLNSYQEMGKKISNYFLTINPETGITYGEERSIKAAETMKKINPKTGLTIRQEADLKRLATRKRNKAKKEIKCKK